MHLGGAEKHALALMDQMSRLGHTPIYAGQRGSWLTREVQKRGYPFYHVGMHGFYDAVSMAKLAFIAKKECVDLIHGHLTRGAFYAGIAGKLSSIPSIATAHSTNAGKHFGGVDHIIAVSEAVKQFLIEKGYPPRIITHVYNGIKDRYEDENINRQTMRKSLGLDDENIALCFVGRFLKDKGQDLAIEALSKCRNGNLRLFFAGNADTPWGKEIRAMAENFDLEKRVVFMGEVKNVAAFLSAMDIALVPSRREAISLALLEACSMQKAVIAASVGGIPEVIRHGENGLLVPAEESGTLAEAIDRLAADKDERVRLGRSARQEFLHRFTAEAMGEATEKVFHRLTKEKSQ